VVGETVTQEPVTAVAGTRVAGPGPVNVGGQATQAALTPTSTVEPTATPVPPTVTAVPDDEEDEPDPTATPEPEPTATPEPTAVTGPQAVIVGPRTAEVGQSATYTADTGTGNRLRVDWQTPNGFVPIQPGFSITFGSAGCYSISMTATFSDSPQLSTSIVVSVGGADCGVG
jgi:hypothetical protein